MIRLIIKRVLFGIASGCVFLALTGILADAFGMYFLAGSFTVQALGFMAVGAGFSVSTIAYDIDRLVLWMQVLVNIVVGFGIFFLVSFSLGWLSIESPAAIIITVIANTLTFIAIGFGYYLLNEREAKRINAKLKERDSKK